MLKLIQGPDPMAALAMRKLELEVAALEGRAALPIGSMDWKELASVNVLWIGSTGSGKTASACSVAQASGRRVRTNLPSGVAVRMGFQSQELASAHDCIYVHDEGSNSGKRVPALVAALQTHRHRDLVWQATAPNLKGHALEWLRYADAVAVPLIKATTSGLDELPAPWDEMSKEASRVSAWCAARGAVAVYSCQSLAWMACPRPPLPNGWSDAVSKWTGGAALVGMRA